MTTASSSTYASIKKNAKFEFGIAPLPYYPDVPGAPQNTVIGGASLWVMSGKKPAEYKGVAAFFNYLTDPEIQAKSHQRTGYLPITLAAFELTEKSGFYKENPGTDTAVNQMIRKTTDKSRGIRLGNMLQVRAIVNEELEQVWAGKKTAEGGAGRRGQARQRAAGAVRESQQVGTWTRDGALGGFARPGAAACCAHLHCAAKPAIAEKRLASAAQWKSASASARLTLPWLLLAPQLAVIAHLLLLAGGAGAAPVAAACRTRSAPARSSSGSTTSAGCSATSCTSSRSRRRRSFALLVACCGIGLALLIAVFADRVLRGAALYKTLLVWPYAVAPAVAGVLWLFMFAPSIGMVSFWLRASGFDWNHLLEPEPRDDADRDGGGLEADHLQLPVLPRRAAVDPEVPDRGGSDRRRRTLAPFLDDRLPAAVADHFLPAGDQHRLRVLRHVRHRRRGHRGRPRARRPRSWSTRSTTTGSRRWISARPPRSLWC